MDGAGVTHRVRNWDREGKYLQCRRGDTLDVKTYPVQDIMNMFNNGAWKRVNGGGA